jgi:hypothetical protein
MLRNIWCIFNEVFSLNVLHILWHVSHKLQHTGVYNLNIHALLNSLIDNANKCTGVKVRIFTYSPLAL